MFGVRIITKKRWRTEKAAGNIHTRPSDSNFRVFKCKKPRVLVCLDAIDAAKYAAGPDVQRSPPWGQTVLVHHECNVKIYSNVVVAYYTHCCASLKGGRSILKPNRTGRGECKHKIHPLSLLPCSHPIIERKHCRNDILCIRVTRESLDSNKQRDRTPPPPPTYRLGILLSVDLAQY